MGDPYGFPVPEDLRRLISPRTTTLFPPLPDPLSLHHHHNTLNPPPHYDPMNFVTGGDTVFFPPTRSAANNNPFSHYYPSSSNSLNPSNTTSSSVALAAASDHAFCSSNMDTAAEKAWLGGFDSGTNRWPRQETLSLLEIRSRLDSKFRENNQKAPLWNEISRIMAEEFGYQRSGKKCKEKFENLYKYYKKTKEGKASRQDGKHYRFFRQLEAICGGGGGAEPSNTTHPSPSHHHAAVTNTVQTPTSFKINHRQQEHINFVDHHHHHLNSSESHLSFSNSSELETSSSENNNNNNDEDLSAIAYMLNNNQKEHSSSSRDNNKQKGLLLELGDDNNNSNHHQRPARRRSLRAKVEEIVGSHMKKIIETQDAWMERMLSVVEQREQEIASKEEERKKKESMKFDQEVHELWAKERAWVEARDAALIEVVRKHIGNNNKSFEEMVIGRNNNKNKIGWNGEYHNSGGWSEMEISNLIQLRTGFEQRLMRENNSNNNNSNSNNNGNGYMLENGVWEEIAGKLGCMGYERSAGECKQIWDEISISIGRTVVDECGARTRPWCLGLKLTDDDDL